MYNRTIRTLARSKVQKRSLRKESTADRVRQWLGESRLPSDAELRAIGESIAAQNGLRRFIHASMHLGIWFRMFRPVTVSFAEMP